MYSEFLRALQKAKEDPEADLEEIAEGLVEEVNERRELESTAMVFAHALLTRNDRIPKKNVIITAFELAKDFRDEAENKE